MANSGIMNTGTLPRLLSGGKKKKKNSSKPIEDAYQVKDFIPNKNNKKSK